VSYDFRTFARAPLACGSMVLYLCCVSFFAPAGEKTTHKREKRTGKRKS
jgi:hypothetical protein